MWVSCLLSAGQQHKTRSKGSMCKGGENMGNERFSIEAIEKTLEKQLQLLSERSFGCTDQELADISAVMVRIAEWFLQALAFSALI